MTAQPMTDITIPPAALEDWARAMCTVDPPCDACRNTARATFLAMLAAWPGMQHDNYVIILPLTQEQNND